jgi:hypothetical protein
MDRLYRFTVTSEKLSRQHGGVDLDVFSTYYTTEKNSRENLIETPVSCSYA